MASNDEETSNNDTATDTTSSTQRALESIMRISLAGFGGALVGLSLSRQKQASRSIRPRAMDSTLPMNWAFACAGFCSLIEVSRWASPTSLVTSDRRLQTIGDFVIGGAAAGATFRGAQVVSQASSLKRPTNILSGLATGIVLGCLAGLVQCAADVGEEMVEEERARRLSSMQSHGNSTETTQTQPKEIER